MVDWKGQSKRALVIREHKLRWKIYSTIHQSVNKCLNRQAKNSIAYWTWSANMQYIMRASVLLCTRLVSPCRCVHHQNQRKPKIFELFMVARWQNRWCQSIPMTINCNSKWTHWSPMSRTHRRRQRFCSLSIIDLLNRPVSWTFKSAYQFDVITMTYRNPFCQILKMRSIKYSEHFCPKAIIHSSIWVSKLNRTMLM